MKPRVRAYSLDHYRWHYEPAKFNVNYYNGWEYSFYVTAFNNNPWFKGDL